MKVTEIRIVNFKGIKELILNTDGKSVEITGDNGTGKTTVGDAISWLVTGKDTAGSAKFSIKPLNENGTEQHGLETSVGMKIEHEGHLITFKKTYNEKWTRRRGSSVKELTSHTIGYFIGNGSVKTKVWDAEIERFFGDSETFRILTDPMFFSSELHWKKRREILCNFCDFVGPKEVFTHNPDLKPLEDDLDGATVESYWEAKRQERTDINRQITEISPRIDEQMKRIYPPENVDRVKQELETAKQTVERLREELVSVPVPDNSENKAFIFKIGEAIKEVQIEKDRIWKEHYAAVDAARTAYNEARHVLSDHHRKVERHGELVAEAVTKVDALKDEYRKAARVQPGNCPSCGQPIPEARFRASRTATLENITRNGKAAKARMQRLQSERQELMSKTDGLTAEVSKHGKALNKLTAPDTSKLDEELEVLIEQNRKATGALSTDPDSSKAISEKKAELQQAERQLDKLKTEWARIEASADAEKRVEELKEEEIRLGTEFEKVEKKLALCETYQTNQSELIEASLNRKFENINFALFRTQMNGGVEEICEASFNGIPFGSGLNLGARVNAGLEIIGVLQEYYKMNPILIIDNAESVTEIKFPENTQFIKLVVAKGQKKLKTKYI